MEIYRVALTRLRAGLLAGATLVGVAGVAIAGFFRRTSSGSSHFEPRSAVPGSLRLVFSASASTSVRATVSDPMARKPVAGTSAPIAPQRWRASSASSSSFPLVRPLIQTSPKLRTEAPLGAPCRSSWITSNPRRTPSSACIVPSTPPPTTTGRGLLVMVASRMASVG